MFKKLSLCALAIALTSPMVQADEWEYSFSPYAILTSSSGTSTIANNEASADVDFEDYVDVTDYAFFGQFTALHSSNYGVTFDLIHGKLSDDSVLDVEEKSTLSSLYGFKRYQRTTGFIDILAGIKYRDVSLSIDMLSPAGIPALDDMYGPGSNDMLKTILADPYSGGDNWIEPTVGIRGLHQLSDSWAVSGHADISGLVGSTGLNWSAQLDLLYSVTESITLGIGYHAIGIDYDNDKAGSQNFAMDVVIQGPEIGMSFKF